MVNMKVAETLAALTVYSYSILYKKKKKSNKVKIIKGVS